MTNRARCASGLMLLAAVGAASGVANAQQAGEVIITEIFAATNQNFSVGFGERPQEFIELFNTTANPIDVSGWTIVDDVVTSPFPDGTIIPAGGALIVCGNDGDPSDDTAGNFITEEIFRAAWEPNPNIAGGAIQLIVLEQFESLANGPSSTNEIIQLFASDGTLQDEVNFDDASPWPLDNPQGTTIALRPQFLNAIDNDEGCSWVRSDQAPEGFITNRVFVDLTTNAVVPDNSPNSELMYGEEGDEFGVNTGSPGYVELVSVFNDCNGNGIDDILDICSGFSLDCNNNSIPDECEEDCNNNGIPDECDIINDAANNDCNANGLLDECEIADNPNLDLDGNGVLDVCEAAGDVIITEIMFNPPTDESESEWVEIKNISDSVVSLDGWTLGDLEDLPASDPIAGASLQPGEVAVLINDFTPDNLEPDDAYFGLDPVTEFRTAWDIPASVQIIALTNAGFRGNTAVPGDEILAIFDAAGIPSDIVDYISDESLGTDWPADDGTASIYLIGSAQDGDANNQASAWALSIDGVAGAYSSNGSSTLHSSVRATATPGFVTDTDPAPVDGPVIITEFHHVTNPLRAPIGTAPDGTTGVDIFLPNEFVEILNVSGADIDISGWYLRDEDGFTDIIPAGTNLAADEAAILYQADVSDGGNTFEFASDSEGKQAFYDAWGCGYQVIPLKGWSVDRNRLPDSRSLRNLANGPSLASEILTLRDSSGGLIDLVNFDDDGTIWPFDGTGDPALEAFSFILLPGNYDGISNDSGFNWTVSFVPFEEARNNVITDIWNADGLTAASPGAVDGVVVPDLNDCPDLPCSVADLAEPFGVINFFDISAYITLFNAGDIQADLAAPFGSLNFFDVAEYINLFNAGCP